LDLDLDNCGLEVFWRASFPYVLLLVGSATVDLIWAVCYIALVAGISMMIRVAENRIEKEGDVGHVALNRTEMSPSCTATPSRHGLSCESHRLIRWLGPP
jgi:hypothetical protein